MALYMYSMGDKNYEDSTGKRNVFSKDDKGKILILGGSGFLGGNVAKRAVLAGYRVTSLSRRGKPEPPKQRRRNRRNRDNNGADNLNNYDSFEQSGVMNAIDYRCGDATDISTIREILNEGDEEYKAVVHCIGLLFDGDSGLAMWNRFVSQSGSLSDSSSTYDDITRATAINAIQATEECLSSNGKKIPFVFTSAAEAGWTDVSGGGFVEKRLTPRWLKRYLQAKRAVEERLSQSTKLRPIIFRPSFIFSLDNRLSITLPPVTAFFVGNQVGLPFVDRPVSVQALSSAIIRSLSNDSISGVQRYKEINELSR